MIFLITIVKIIIFSCPPGDGQSDNGSPLEPCTASLTKHLTEMVLQPSDDQHPMQTNQELPPAKQSDKHPPTPADATLTEDRRRTPHTAGTYSFLLNFVLT